MQSSVSDSERVEDVFSMAMCGEKSIWFIFKGYRHSALCFTKDCFEPVFIWLSGIELLMPKESSCLIQWRICVEGQLGIYRKILYWSEGKCIKSNDYPSQYVTDRQSAYIESNTSPCSFE